MSAKWKRPVDDGAAVVEAGAAFKRLSEKLGALQEKLKTVTDELKEQLDKQTLDESEKQKVYEAVLKTDEVISEVGRLLTRTVETTFLTEQFTEE